MARKTKTKQASKASRELASVKRALASSGQLFAQWNKQRRAQSTAMSGTQQRLLRNEQRNIGRDIRSTQKAIDSTTDSRAKDNLQKRLASLQDLRENMLRANKRDGVNVYNPASVRLEALETYMMDFKGVGNLKQQAMKVRQLKLSEGAKRFSKRLQNALRDELTLTDVIDTPYGKTRLYDELMRDLKQAVRQYDSGRAGDIMRTIHSQAVSYNKAHANTRTR